VDEGGVEESASLEIADPCGNRLVAPHADLGQGLVEVAVVVPALPVVDELQEPNPALDEAAEDLAVDVVDEMSDGLGLRSGFQENSPPGRPILPGHRLCGWKSLGCRNCLEIGQSL
jgi:hypothetical protein